MYVHPFVNFVQDFAFLWGPGLSRGGGCVCVFLVCKVIFEYQVILCGSGPNHNNNTHGTAQGLFCLS
jgi:hypothetical protein